MAKKERQVHQDGFNRFNCVKPATNAAFTLDAAVVGLSEYKEYRK